MFVDGENLAIRYKEILKEKNEKEKAHVIHEPDVFVWSEYASRKHSPQDFIRRYYYTSSRGDELRRKSCEDQLRDVGIEAPRVFHRKGTRKSKGVDIALATDMLTHAHRKNYDVAILVSGDGDFFPLVEAVKNEGRRVAVWFFEGISPALKRAADHYWNIGELLFHDEASRPAFKDLFG